MAGAEGESQALGLDKAARQTIGACALARAAPSSEVFEVTVMARARCPEGGAGHGPCAVCHTAHIRG